MYFIKQISRGNDLLRAEIVDKFNIEYFPVTKHSSFSNKIDQASFDSFPDAYGDNDVALQKLINRHNELCAVAEPSEKSSIAKRKALRGAVMGADFTMLPLGCFRANYTYNELKKALF